ncbi:hypothetical protein ABZ137_37990 [Streptomyces bobili]|uniref:hypothetical protein n=1 Tax=Streptomyces bobili TaxID=67280 RepID=UPI0033BBB473
MPLTRETDDPGRPDAETGADAFSVDSPFALVKPRVGWLTWTVVTFLALCHLVLVAAVLSGIALTTGIGDDDWALWFFVAINVFMHLTVASAFGGRQIGTIALSWIVPLFTIGMTTLSGLMLDEHWPSNWPPPWLVWPVLFAPGLAALTYAWRIWFGQLQTRRPATFEDPPE